jgi:hypothetical protein
MGEAQTLTGRGKLLPAFGPGSGGYGRRCRRFDCGRISEQRRGFASFWRAGGLKSRPQANRDVDGRDCRRARRENAGFRERCGVRHDVSHRKASAGRDAKISMRRMRPPQSGQ